MLLLDEVRNGKSNSGESERVFSRLVKLLKQMSRYNAALPQSELKQQINFRFCNVLWREFADWACPYGDEKAKAAADDTLTNRIHRTSRFQC